MGTVGIRMTTQPILVAPAPIWLEATNPTGFEDEIGMPIAEPQGGEIWDPTFHKITYIWTVEEETAPGVWTQMSGAYPRVINMVTGWNEAYVAYGKRIAFRLPDAGTYRFQLWCIDMQGNTGLATTSTITVQTREAAFAVADRIVVAADGDFTGAPSANPGNQVTTVAAASALLQAATTPKWVSFKNGETHDQVTLDARDGYCDHVDVWDLSGSRVEIYAPRTTAGNYLGHFHMNDSSQSLQCTFHKVAFLGLWDDRTETGDKGDANVFEVRFVTVATKFMCYDCDFVGLGAVWLTLGGNPAFNGASIDRRFMIADCIATSFRNYGFYSYYNHGGEYTFLGSSVYRNHDALAGPVPGQKLELRNDHGPIRLTTYQHTYMACCDFFGCSGWSAGSFGPSANGNVRLFAGTPETGEQPSLIVDRCVNEGGYITWKLDGQDSGAPEVPGNWLFDKVLTLCTARTLIPWALAFGGATRRNCYTWAPDIPYYDRQPSNSFDRIIDYRTDGTGTGPGNFAVPMLDYCNTEMVLASFPAVPLTDGNEADWGALYVRENSINHQPNASSGAVATFGPINSNPATEVVPGVTPRFSGVRWNYRIIDLGITSLADGASVDIAYPDSSDGLGNGDLTQTNQAYWLALPPSDNLHAISLSGDEHIPYLFSRGDFTVEFLASVIRITNTSGYPWNASGTPSTIQLHLDRKSRLTTDIPPQIQYASPSSVPMPRPQSGSAALGAADIGYVAYDDFLGTVRSRPKTAGAIEI